MAKSKKKKLAIFNRIFSFRSKIERLLNVGTLEHMDIPPGMHHFVCNGQCRVILFTDQKEPRSTFIFKPGRWRIVVNGDVLVTVQCANDVEWEFELATASEVLDPTRIEVPLELQASNKAHTDLRYMIDRFMRGAINIQQKPRVEEDEETRDNFDTTPDHVFSRYEQRVFDDEQAAAARSAKPSPATTVAENPVQPLAEKVK